MGNVVVIGSLNYDCIALVDEFPRPGNTLMAKDLLFRLGGKGANQAVAAAAQGGNVFMIGSVGDDGAGDAYKQYLERRNIRIDGLVTREGVATGTAMICVNSRAENTIVVGRGANGTLTPAEVEAQQQYIAMGTIMLAQLEVPLDAVVAGLKMARPMGTATCLNPSPWRSDFPWGEVELDFVIVNEHEARQLLGKPVLSLNDAEWIHDKIRDMNIHALIVTRGAHSTLTFTDSGPPLEIPVMVVEAVDTVGAGDSFSGAFAARWSELRALEPALRAASVAGSLATLKAGAQEATPTREEVDEALTGLG